MRMSRLLRVETLGWLSLSLILVAYLAGNKVGLLAADRAAPDPTIPGKPQTFDWNRAAFRVPQKQPVGVRSFVQFVDDARRARLPYKLSLKEFAQECARAQLQTGRIP